MKRLGLALSIVLLGLVAACEKSLEPATRLMLVSDTDISALDEVTFDVFPRGREGEVKRRHGPVRPGQPAWLVMEREGSASLGPYDVLVRGVGIEGNIERRAFVSFVEGKSMVALLHLEQSCVDRASACEAQGLVCARGACRDKTIAEAELVAWTGVLPTLKPRSDSDPSTDGDGDAGDGDAPSQDSGPGGDGDVGDGDVGDGDVGDGDVGDGDVGGDGDAGIPQGDGDAGTCVPKSCQDGKEVLCAQGRVVNTRACSSPGQCKRGLCVPGEGCTVQDDEDGTSCGTSAVCQDGVCSSRGECSNNCQPTCDPGVAACELDCSNVNNCNPECPENMSCDITCSNVNCRTRCSGSCNVTCSGTNCELGCDGSGSCSIDCDGANKCTNIVCGDEASCLLRCGTSNSCGFEKCKGEVKPCANGVLVCGRLCPEEL